MNPEIQQALASFLQEDQNEIWEGARALVRLEANDATDQLIEFAGSPGPVERRIAALWTLGFLRALRATEPLLTILNDLSEHPAVRAQAAESLGYIGDSDKASEIRPSVVNSLRDPNPDVVYWSAFALRTVGDLTVVPNLQELAASTGIASNGESIATEAKEAMDQVIQKHANRDQ
jgi:HEAT repeat protein